MANGLETTKISELPEAITLNESDYSFIVQNGTSKKIKGLLLKGNAGDNGKSIEIQKTDTHIQWRQEGGQWINLVALADLKGDKGEQGGGSNVDLTDYATKVWVTQQLASYYTKAEIDLSISNKADISHTHTEYASIDHVHNYNDLANKPTIPSKTSDLANDSGFLISIPSEYVTEEEMNTALSTKANTSDIPSLEGYATETFVTNKIAEASLSGGEVDLSGYATKDDLTSKVDKVEGKSLSTNDLTNELKSNYDEAYLHSQSTHVQSSDIPTKTSDLKNDSGFITSIPEEYITETELNAKGYLTSHQDISGLQPKTDNGLATTNKTVVGAINEIKTEIDNIEVSGSGGGLTIEQTNQLTTAYEHSQSAHVQASDIPSLEGYATETFVTNNYASKNHNHNEYASSSHRHDASEIDNLPSGGGVSQEDINTAVNNYLTEHPVQSGATAQQAAQIEANKTAIGDGNSGLTKKVNDLTVSLSNVDAVSLNGKSFSEPMTKAEYEAISAKDPNILYLVNDDQAISGIPDYSSSDANKVLAVNSDGTALAWIDAPTGSGSGLTTEQANQLTTAYNHSQTIHVQTSDIPTKLSQLENDLVLVSDGGKKFKLKVSNDGVLSAELYEVYADIIISNNTLSVNESSSNTFTVALDKAPTSNQVVSLSVNNNNCTLDKTSLTFTSDNYTNQTVRVTGAHDSNSYEDKSSIITLSSDNVTSKTINVTVANIDVPLLQSISAVYTQGNIIVNPTTSLDSLKSNLVVTATYSDNNTNTITDYSLSGTLTVGKSTITVTYQDKTTTFDVNVVENTEPVLQSISAVYTQADNIIYPASPLNALTFNLVVTATYSDNTTTTIASADYVLSGTLTLGTSIITVTYQDKTTTFDVNVVEKPSISEFTSEHFIIGVSNKEAVNGYFTVNKADDIRIRINFKSKEIAMALLPSTVYDVTLNIIENTMDSAITNSTSAILFNSYDRTFNPPITANYTGETTFKATTVQEYQLTDRVNRFYSMGFMLNNENATTGSMKFSISMKPHVDNV